LKSAQSSRRRVVVTGIGALTPVGNDAQQTWQAFVAGQSGVARVTQFDPTGYPVRIGAEVKGFDPVAHIPPKEARRMARCTQLAIVAGRQAVADAALDWAREDRERAAVIFATGFGGVELLVEPIQKAVTHPEFTKIAPHIPIECLANIPAFHIGLEQGCLGPLSTIVTACAAGTQAMGEATELIRRGAADIVLTGGTESQMNPLFYVGFTSMRVLSARNDEPARASRPFDAERDGFVIGEGAVVFVLEELERALARDARIYAEVLGQAASADAYHVAQPQADGAGPARCMRWALADAGIEPEEVQYINAHGSATVQNDAAETAAIKGVFGKHAYRMAISSTKSMIGHLFGAAGAVEALATIMAVYTDMIHPTINLETPDPACDLDYVPNVARRQRVEIAMSNSFGLGGQNACLVFGKWQG
jgi:3-oxoacyl-[acyl-carrier-protein] synthase II